MNIVPNRNHFELLHDPAVPGAFAGFRMVGRARDSSGSLCRIWLRRVARWDRYVDPRQPVGEWDCRSWIRADSAFALQVEWTINDLDAMAEIFEFPQQIDALRAIKPNGDRVFDAVIAWAQRVTNSLPTTAKPPAIVSDAGWDETESVVNARLSAAVAVAPEPSTPELPQENP